MTLNAMPDDRQLALAPLTGIHPHALAAAAAAEAAARSRAGLLGVLPGEFQPKGDPP